MMEENGDLAFKQRANASPDGWSADRIKVDPSFTTTGGEHKGFWVLGLITEGVLRRLGMIT